MKRLVLVVDYNDNDELASALDDVKNRVVDRTETRGVDIDFSGSFVRPRVIMSFSTQEV